MSVIEIRTQEQFEQLLRSTKIVLADCKPPFVVAMSNNSSLGSMVCPARRCVTSDRQGVGLARSYHPPSKSWPSNGPAPPTSPSPRSTTTS
jgi:hypothetical protein